MSNSGLLDSVEGLYATFAGYPAPKYTDPCLCCHTLEQDEKLRSKPLRKLGLDELRDYANDALLVWGDTQVFKHFLPRIYDLYIATSDPSLEICDPEIMFSKLRYGQWRHWPEVEQVAIRAFLRAVWTVTLQTSPGHADTESWLCALGQSEDDLGPYLDQWERDESQSACLALSALLVGSAGLLAGNQDRNPFWSNRDKQYSQLQQWAKSSAVKMKLRRALERWKNTDMRAEFETALAILC